MSDVKKPLSLWRLLHPIFFAIFPALTYYASNSSEALLENVIAPILITLAGTLVVWGVAAVWTKHTVRASVYTSGLLLWFVTYVHVNTLLKGSMQGPYIFALYVALLVVGVGLLYRFKLPDRVVGGMAGFLTIVGAYMVLSAIWRIVPIEIERANSQVNLRVTQDESVQKELNASLKKEPIAKPDIYYIVPDRYGRQDILKEFYGYDNSAFIGALRERGFYVADKAHANYPKTFLSLASSLNLRHINTLSDTLGKKTSDNYPVFQMVQNNSVATYLKKQGYRFIYSGDWWEPTRVNRLADRNINLYANSDEFLRKYGQTTILNPLFHFVFKKGDLLGFSDNRVRENHIYKFAELKKVAADEPGPKFVLVHMLIPHSPYVLDKNCEAFTSDSDQRDPEEYIDQLQCTNKHLLEIIDSILAESAGAEAGAEPVIILQSDEGPFKVDEMNQHGEGVDWTKVSDDALRHHMGILNAYRVPAWQDDPELYLYPRITPVQTFRLLFNTYFGTTFEALEDRSYMIPHLNYPYDMRDITDRVLE